MTSTHTSHTDTPNNYHSNSLHLDTSNYHNNWSNHRNSIGTAIIKSLPGNEKGDLFALTATANNVRRTLQSPDRTTDLNPPSSWSQSAINNIINTTKGTKYCLYPHGRIYVNASDANGHSNTDQTNTDGSAFGPYSYHKNSAGLSQHLNTGDSSKSEYVPTSAKSAHANSNIPTTSSYDSSVATSILNTLNSQIVGRTWIPAFGQISFTGSNTYHGQHSSHRN